MHGFAKLFLLSLKLVILNMLLLLSCNDGHGGTEAYSTAVLVVNHPGQECQLNTENVESNNPAW